MKIWKIIFWLIILLVFIFAILLIFSSPKAKANPGTNISSINEEHFAWNDVIGWIDFCKLSGGVCTLDVYVFDDRLEGYADSDAGPVALNCNSTPAGDICGQSNFRVANTNGALSGWAWNNTIGWISFRGSNYGVNIDTGNGNFNGYAWNEIVGWISFNCADPGVCPTSTYKVKTNWQAQESSGFLESSIFNMTVQGILNSIIWQTDPNIPSDELGGSVKFQIAVSDIDNPPAWIYYGPDSNPSCDGQGQQDTFFGPDLPNIPIPIDGCDQQWVKTKQYLRYKVFIQSGLNGRGQTASPIVTDIILNWSR